MIWTRLSPLALIAAVAFGLAGLATDPPGRADAGKTSTTSYSYSLSGVSASPTAVAPGTTLSLSGTALTKTAGTATVTATITNSSGQSVWQTMWASQAFSASVARTFSAAWGIPSNQAGGTYTLTYRVLNSSGAALAAPVSSAFTINVPVSLDAEEQALLNQINQYRASKKLGSLSLRSTLYNTAKWMSGDMASKSYLNHTDSLSRTPSPRALAFGYSLSTLGENLAAGPQYGVDVFNQWMASSTHNAVMLTSSYTTIGLGRGFSSNSAYGWYWAANFGQ